MAGNLMLLCAMALHARYVLLDAEGLLPRRQPAAEDAENEEDDEEAAAAGGRRAVDEDRPAPRHAAAGIPTGGHGRLPAAASPTASRCATAWNKQCYPGPCQPQVDQGRAEGA